MRIKSNVLNREFEIELFKKDNAMGITHDCLLNILENQLDDVIYNIETITATSNYAGVSCTIENKITGRKVFRVGEINLETLDRKSANYDFICSHLLFVATKYAIDAAVVAYLDIKSTYTQDEINSNEQQVQVQEQSTSINDNNVDSDIPDYSDDETMIEEPDFSDMNMEMMDMEMIEEPIEDENDVALMDGNDNSSTFLGDDDAIPSMDDEEIGMIDNEDIPDQMTNGRTPEEEKQLQELANWAVTSGKYKGTKLKNVNDENWLDFCQTHSTEIGKKIAEYRRLLQKG